jgi:hypothetical protein
VVLACLDMEAAVASTGGRSRLPPGFSRHAPHGHSTLQQPIVALAALRLSESFPT